MNEKQAYALGYFYGRSEGSYGMLDLDQFTDIARHEFHAGYESGVSDYCLVDIDQEENE